MTKLAIVVNKKASRTEGQLSGLKTSLDAVKQGWVYRAEVEPDELKSAIGKALKKKPDVLIIGGGDGTVISAIEQARKASFKGDFAILPLGTANYLARNLDIPLDAEAALEVALNGSAREAYLSSVNGRLFSLMASAGLTTGVSKQVTVKQKQRFGQLAYVAHALRMLGKQESFKYEITTKSKQVKGTTHQILVLNADLNQHLPITPEGDLESPNLRVLIYESNRSAIKVLFSVLTYLVSIGKFRPGLAEYRVGEAKIDTTPRQDISVDGEVHTKTPMDVGVVKQPVSIITNRGN